MGLQYSTDNSGKATGVFIPMQSWEEFKEKYKLSDDAFWGLSSEQVQALNQRIEEHLANPTGTLVWQDAKHQLESKV